jgi:hypothetical protein
MDLRVIRDAVGSSTIFLPNTVPKYSQSRFLVQYRDLPVSNGSGASTIRDSLLSLPDDEYHVLQPIPVVFEKTADGWIAWFEHAGIGMSGATMTEAKELLSHDIIDAFILYTENEDKLGPGPETQLRVLKSYITWGNDYYQK